MTGEPPFFFLTYAHTNQRALVARVYEDICAEIWERTPWPNEVPPGFMDRRDIATGADWRTAVAGALGTCRVLVPLYSPKYFNSPECGREFHGFTCRVVSHHARHGGTVMPVVPALWTPVADEHMPEAVRRLQADFDAVHQTYAREGLYTLVKNASYRRVYLQVIKYLAEQIIGYAESSEMVTDPPHQVDLSRDAFHVEGEPATESANRLTVMVAAPIRDRLPPGRSPEYYGYDAAQWAPYRPLATKAVVELVETISRDLDYVPRVMALEKGLNPNLWSDPNSGIGVVLLDPWICLQPDYRDQVHQIDRLGAGRIGVIAVWNVNDPETVNSWDALRTALRTEAPSMLGDPGTPTVLGSSQVHSLNEFADVLTAVLGRAMNRRLNGPAPDDGLQG